MCGLVCKRPASPFLSNQILPAYLYQCHRTETSVVLSVLWLNSTFRWWNSNHPDASPSRSRYQILYNQRGSCTCLTVRAPTLVAIMHHIAICRSLYHQTMFVCLRPWFLSPVSTRWGGGVGRWGGRGVAEDTDCGLGPAIKSHPSRRIPDNAARRGTARHGTAAALLRHGGGPAGGSINDHDVACLLVVIRVSPSLITTTATTATTTTPTLLLGGCCCPLCCCYEALRGAWGNCC